MDNLKPLMSSKNMDWGTPQDFFNKLNGEFNFTLDFCAEEYNKKCKKFYTEEQNALKQNPKGEVIFCNPPYGRAIKDFVKKCFELSKDNKVVMLIPARTDTSYFHDYIYNKAEIRFIRGRLKFTREGSKGDPAPFPSAVIVFK